MNIKENKKSIESGPQIKKEFWRVAEEEGLLRLYFCSNRPPFTHLGIKLVYFF